MSSYTLSNIEKICEQNIDTKIGNVILKKQYVHDILSNYHMAVLFHTFNFYI